MRGKNYSAILTLFATLIFLAGCTKSQNPIGSNSGIQSVNMSVAFSKSGAIGLSKSAGAFSVDSLRIDSAIVVFQRIKFESHIDSVMVDTTEDYPGHESDDGHGDDLVFRGPFVVHVRDTTTINFAQHELPAGTYDGINFKIHRIGFGEGFEDSDDLNHHPKTRSDSSFMGSSIVVWGKVKKSGVWVPFTFRYNSELEFKLKGNFVVESATNSLNVVLRFDIGAWFRDPSSGALLDPTDLSPRNRSLIYRALRQSFQAGRGGHDHDGNGFPDND
jgi:hypothetical protein